MTLHAHDRIQPADTELVAFWNEVLAPKFVRYRHILVGGLSRHSAAVMPALDIAPGDSALDVGCGFGDTAVEIAGRVGPEGAVLGIDCCDAFLDQARSLAEAGSAANVRFERGDAEIGLEEGVHDFVFSRFGTMFFANPVRGLRSMRKALKPGGRIAHIVWRRREDNPWVNAPHAVLRKFLPAPGEDARTCGPGPFSMASEEVTRAQMAAAGFTDIAFRRIDAKVMVGRDIEDAIGFQLAIGPAGETFRAAGPRAEAMRPEIDRALAELFAGVERTQEGFWMESSSWLITARAPE
ncbi:MAG TPA: methyltransferase domain-containing protein [Amaricoccus sp.]|uniref:class I SAM-dependent methyltransferase n=1 Tax=Amaricoccus sp. TaxID=1872485 RepID=UPI002C91AF3E|nr:methyltransferase domain-containing protein [Amaricoccus sp.]HPG22180.1 methyltransferase domain-containing protein [Amaricoccus sp.]HRW14131.1 methyltransferase domain-containing protein [Amaricoccus sp.]